MIKRFELLVVSSIWISIVSACFPKLISLVYDVPYQPIYSILAFLCTFFVYSIDKVSGSKEDLLNTPERAILANYPIKQIATLAYVLAILLAIATDWHLLPNVLAFAAAGWLYTVRVAGHRPKDIPGLKNLIVASACSYCFAGMVGHGYALVFLIILINTILFDIRDVVGDTAARVRTLPVLFGPSRTIGGLMILNIVLAFIHPISALIGGCLLWYFRIPRSNLKYDLWIDGWPILSLILTCGLSIAFIY